MEHSERAAAASATAAPTVIDRRAVRLRVLALAGPVIGQNILETMLGIVDTALVARLGASATAGVGAALQVMFFVIAALSALSIGSAVLVAQAYGARDTERASRLARQSIVWSILIGTPLALLGGLFAEPIISIFGVAPDVARIATDYLQVTMGTMVVLVALFIGGGVLRGAGDSRTPMIVTGIANVVNIGLTYALIYGVAGFPALGAVGSAWGSFLARLLALGLMLVALWRGRDGVSIRGISGWRPDLTVARQILKLGIPAAIEQILTSAAFFTLVIIVARLGTVTLAAHQITFTALSASFLPGFGFAIATTTLVGQSIGARRIAEGDAATKVAVLWAVGWMTVIATLLFIFAEGALGLFTNDAQVIATGAAAMRVVALGQPFWAILFVFPGALRGAGNTRFPLVAGSGSIWLTVGIAAILLHFGGGLPSVWAAFLATSPFVAALYWWRWRRLVREIELREREGQREPRYTPAEDREGEPAAL